MSPFLGPFLFCAGHSQLHHLQAQVPWKTQVAHSKVGKEAFPLFARDLSLSPSHDLLYFLFNVIFSWAWGFCGVNAKPHHRLGSRLVTWHTGRGCLVPRTLPGATAMEVTAWDRGLDSWAPILGVEWCGGRQGAERTQDHTPWTHHTSLTRHKWQR